MALKLKSPHSIMDAARQSANAQFAFDKSVVFPKRHKREWQAAFEQAVIREVTDQQALVNGELMRKDDRIDELNEANRHSMVKVGDAVCGIVDANADLIPQGIRTAIKTPLLTD